MVFLVALVVAVAAFMAWRSARRSVELGRGPLGQAVGGAPLAVAAVAALVAVAQCITVVPAGHVGVVDFFGSVSPTSLKAGINMRNPLAHIAKMSIKTQELKEVMDVPSKEGLTVGLEISALFHLDPERAPEVYKTIGPNYEEIILQPQFRSVARGVTATYDAKALYTSEREVVARTILADLQKLVEPRGITVESTPLRQVGLPKGLTQAIEEKLRAEQESQRMQFVLLKEKQEAERKRIEAQGIADFQRIVAQGISEPLLAWKGIEATQQLAHSQNAKIVIIGNPKNGMPLIIPTDQK